MGQTRQVEQFVQGLSRGRSRDYVAAVDDARPPGSVPEPEPPAGLRIGELSRRVGVSPAVLRAWERRYGVLRPERSRSGQRLYSEADERRVRRVLELIARGYSPAVAARLAAAPAPEPALAPAAPALTELAHELRGALFGLDEAAAESVFDRLLAGFALDTVLRDVVLPFLADLGDCWARDELTVGHEHFASAVIAGRLHALGRGWDAGIGPRAVLACPSHERHDLGLLCFALAMRGRGWRLWYLGADTPTVAIWSVSAQVAAELVVLGAARAEPLVDAADELAGLAAAHRVCIGGRGASPALARRLGAELLPDDPITAADVVSARGGT
jgi:DNA-binding transcriptional MerR regulator